MVSTLLPYYSLLGRRVVHRSEALPRAMNVSAMNLYVLLSTFEVFF